MDDYTTDSRGYYHASYYEQKRVKRRPLAFDSGNSHYEDIPLNLRTTVKFA